MKVIVCIGKPAPMDIAYQPKLLSPPKPQDTYEPHLFHLSRHPLSNSQVASETTQAVDFTV